MAKILKLFWPKMFHLLCFLFLSFLTWRWIVEMKSFDQKTVYIMPQNLWMLYQYIDAFLMLNIGIMQKIILCFLTIPVLLYNKLAVPRGKLSVTLSKFWVSHKKNGTKVFMLKMWSHIHMKMIFNDFEIICWEILELFTDKVH